MAARASIRVRGVTYRSPDEARVAAEEVRHRGDELATELRRNGRDEQADTLQDRAHADAERLLAFARELEAGDAAATTQPADTPATPAKRSRRRRSPPVGASRTAVRSSDRSSVRRAPRPARQNRAGRAARRAGTDLFGGGYRRSGAQGTLTSAGGFGWEIAGWTIGLAFLTLFLTGRGSSAFAGLTGVAGAALRLVVDPVDPLAPGALAPVPAKPAATVQTRTRTAASAAAARSRTGAGVAR